MCYYKAMKISLIIPTYNEGKVIVQTLQQFQSVRGHDFEIIVTDNGSTDNTLELARGLADICVPLSHDVRTSIGACRNRGARVTTGDLLWFIDADIRVPRVNDARHYLVDQFKHNVELVAATFPLHIYAEERTPADTLGYALVNSLTFIQNRILKTGGAPGDCQIVRRSAFERVKGYNTAFYTSEDHDLFHRLSTLGAIGWWKNFSVEMSGRRIHQVGWPRILWIWGNRWWHDMVLRKPVTQEWEARR